MSDSVRLQRRQPTRLHRPWDSPAKNTGVDCHFLLQRMKVKSESKVSRVRSWEISPQEAAMKEKHSPTSFQGGGGTFQEMLEAGLALGGVGGERGTSDILGSAGPPPPKEGGRERQSKTRQVLLREQSKTFDSRHRQRHASSGARKEKKVTLGPPTRESKTRFG